MANTWTFASVLALAQGTDASTRIGNQIYLKEIQFSIQMKPLVTQPVSGCTMRFVVYHNREANGAVPAAADVWASSTSIQSLRSSPNIPKIDLLYDKVTAGVFTSATTSGPPMISQFTIPIGRRIDYTGSGATITAVLKDDYGYAMICSDANSCNMEIKYKLVFTDV